MTETKAQPSQPEDTELSSAEEKRFRSIFPSGFLRRGPGSVEEVMTGQEEPPVVEPVDFPIPPPKAKIYFNGLVAGSGEYLVPPLYWEQIRSVRHPEPEPAPVPKSTPKSDPRSTSWLRRWVEKLENLVERPRRAPVPWVDHQRLDEAGWAVVFPRNTDDKILRKLRPLLDRRREEAGSRYKELTYDKGYRPGDSLLQFLDQNQTGLNAPDAKQLPYFILLVGSPEEIPFEFQYDLDVQYAVGRLHFDDLEDYKRYADHVVQAERFKPALDQDLSFFGVTNAGDPATERLQAELSRPLVRRLLEQEGWSLRSVLGHDATRARLMRLLSPEDRAALLFLSGHGVVYPQDRAEEQRLRQGALVCADWQFGSDLSEEHCFSAPDVPVATKGQPGVGAGKILVHFSCFSAGTPDYDNFIKFSSSDVTADPPRIAKLPQRLLANGTLAYIGHVDRAWDTSFSFLRRASELTTYEAVVRSLTMGFTAGYAMEWLNNRHAQLATLVAAEMDPGRRSRLPLHPRESDTLWLAHNDARNFVLLGDPAVRLLGGHLPRARYVEAVPTADTKKSTQDQGQTQAS